MDALVFCRDEASRRELDSALTRIGFEVETWQNPATLAAHAVQTRPPLLVFLTAEAGSWIGAAIAEVHQASPGTKIIYATQNPGREDGSILEQGVFYYAGNAPMEEIMESAKAVLPQTRLQPEAARPPDEENRHQLRLKPGETFGELFALLVRRIQEDLSSVPGWDGLKPDETAGLAKELHRTLDHFVSAYDICGLKAACFETAEPAGWRRPPEPAVAEPRAWEEVRVLQLELRRGLAEFSDALEAAALRALCRAPGRADTSIAARKAIDEAVGEILGPRIFRDLHGECDMCQLVKHIDPWSIGVL